VKYFHLAVGPRAR